MELFVMLHTQQEMRQLSEGLAWIVELAQMVETLPEPRRVGQVSQVSPEELEVLHMPEVLLEITSVLWVQVLMPQGMRRQQEALVALEEMQELAVQAARATQGL